MFGSRYFGKRYFGESYFPTDAPDELAPIAFPGSGGGLLGFGPLGSAPLSDNKRVNAATPITATLVEPED